MYIEKLVNSVKVPIIIKAKIDCAGALLYTESKNSVNEYKTNVSPSAIITFFELDCSLECLYDIKKEYKAINKQSIAPAIRLITTARKLEKIGNDFPIRSRSRELKACCLVF